MCSVWAARRARSWLRASPRTCTSSGMMLVARPPSMRPMFAVVSASIRPSRMPAIACAATWIALTPRSGAMPACAARPRTTTSMWFAPGAHLAEVEVLRAEEADLLADRQHHVDRRMAEPALAAHAHALADDRDARLVVAAEHGRAVG